ncbi:MAG: hypothetical protein JWQ58_1953 [Reyranella sp.]|nr:hypothetical protein [Reyranella sp.]
MQSFGHWHSGTYERHGGSGPSGSHQLGMTPNRPLPTFAFWFPDRNYFAAVTSTSTSIEGSASPATTSSVDAG